MYLYLQPMYDPMTVAHEIKSPFKNKGGYADSIVTIWHVDPESDGTDDSCGWFLRLRHADKKKFEKIVTDFEFEFKNNYWFTADGSPRFSTSAIVLEMYSRAIWNVLPEKKRGNGRRKFMRKYLYDIIHFAENPTDSLNDYITNEYRYRLIEHDRKQVEPREERIRNLASIIYCDILRKLRPWYKHPKWHIHHWKIQFRPLQRLKRRYWDKCYKCGKRGFKGAAMGSWDGHKMWHQECEKTIDAAA